MDLTIITICAPIHTENHYCSWLCDWLICLPHFNHIINIHLGSIPISMGNKNIIILTLLMKTPINTIYILGYNILILRLDHFYTTPRQLYVILKLQTYFRLYLIYQSSLVLLMTYQFNLSNLRIINPTLVVNRNQRGYKCFNVFQFDSNYMYILKRKCNKLLGYNQ